MSKWRKRTPILVVVLSALALCVAALSFATTEDQKEDYQQQVNAIRSTSQAEVLHPDVAAKLEMEAEIQAKLEAEEEGELPITIRSAVQGDLKVNPFTGSSKPVYTPRDEILWEGFESGSVPPPNWAAVVNNAYTWEIDSYNPYEGTYNASCYYDADYTGTQDEWLVSPAIDLTGKTDWKLEFAWMGSYYWSVDPYDNYDLEVWISTDGGANFTTKLWCEGDVGEFASWVWYEATVDLSGYSAESNVKLGFRYYGYDGAQWSIDAISVNNEAEPIGRCCYDDPAAPLCADVTELECEAMGGYSWDQGLNCTDNPCPVAPENDDCHDVVPDALPATWTGNNEGATYDTYCQWFSAYPNVWHGFTIDECMDITIEYCGCPPGWANGWLNMVTDCDCPDGALISYTSFDWGCANGNPRMYFVHLQAGTYYYPVMLDPGNGAVGDYSLYVHGTPCPPTEPGDNCDNPLMVDIPSSLPWSDLNQTTCGRLDDYDNTCLGSYDGGEDIIYEVTVSSAVTVNITLDPKGTTWNGIAIGTDCPPTNCIDYVTGSSGDPKKMTCVSLDPGVYYIMVDTWPSPDCIPDFDLYIVDTTCEAVENDDCADATAINEVVDLPFSTETATNDGNGYTTGPNIWYCYTATETGEATISLCGSEYDTKLAVYDGCTCDPLGTELAHNDDACGVQSEVKIPVTAGNSYLVEVGGYSTAAGDGILNISVGEPCDIVCVGTPEGEPCINDDEEDVTNGGCNSDPAVWGTIDCDETVCGEWNTYLYGGSNYRDTDWYKFTLTQCSDVTITAVGEFPIVTGFLEQVIDGGGWDCSNFTGYISPYATGDECDTIVVQRLAMNPGDYAIFVGGTVFSGFGCASGTFEYSLSVECVPAEPTYCEASGGCDEYIENVTFETINNTTGCDNYGDYTALSATVGVGNSYPIAITIGNGYSSDTGAVYVDWNQDMDFDDPGEVASLNPGAGAGPYSGTVTVPGDALDGETRMRIRLSWNTDPVPCGTQTYGEVEDYTINVGEPAITYLFEPDPVLVLYKLAIDPMNGYIYLSSTAVGGDVGGMTNVELKVGTCVVPITATEIIPGGYGELTGDVMKLTFGIKEYIECEEDGSLIFGEIESFFDVYYDMTGTPSQMTGQVTMIGHTPGDLNLDGKVNVADVGYFVEYLFAGGPAPVILELADVDGSGGTPNVGDLTYLVEYLFNDGPPPMHQ